MNTKFEITFLALILSIFSSCGIAVYEEGSHLKKDEGHITIVNETYDEDLRVDFSLSHNDHGHVSSMKIAPNSKYTRRYSIDHRRCDPYSQSESCKRKIQFYGDGHLRTYCYGQDVFKVDYSCNSLKCEPIQDNWADVQCFQVQ